MVGDVVAADAGATLTATNKTASAAFRKVTTLFIRVSLFLTHSLAISVIVSSKVADGEVRERCGIYTGRDVWRAIYDVTNGKAVTDRDRIGRH